MMNITRIKRIAKKLTAREEVKMHSIGKTRQGVVLPPPLLGSRPRQLRIPQQWSVAY